MNSATRIPASEHGINPREIDKKARSILEALTKAGYEAYLVGGGVRDLMLGFHPKDFDIATSATPEQVKQVLPSTRIIGRRFRLAHVHFGREYFEVATFRAPHDKTGRGQTGEHGRIIHDNVYGTVVEDAYRRDFSINAFFYDLKTGDVLDFVGAMADLKIKQLRIIGDPVVRYREDPVRMLRAIRFAAKLDLSIEPASEVPIHHFASLLDNIAPARLFDETLKIFHGGKAIKTLELLREFNLFKCLFPAAERGLQEDAVENGGDGSFQKLVYAALRNTDNRIRKDLPVTPAFLFAVMLWKRVREDANSYQQKGNPALQSVHLAASDAFYEQIKCLSVPRRFSNMTREIWTLQGLFKFKNQRRVLNFLNQRRFRAAYDFMCLRAESGETNFDDCEWWTLVQEVDMDEKIAMCQRAALGKHNNKKRKARQKRRISG
ncbi:MAG TPA: polynucleotide adenylyltransferase PcnB [Leucothrix sp.]|nr:polynucleotide adenylyltransferase PcnB [Leucothrix sp.]